MISIRDRWEVGGDHPTTALRLDEKTPEIVKILRLLCGTSVLVVNSDELEDEEYICEENLVNPDDEISQENISKILDYVFEEVPEEDELRTLFGRLNAMNRPFYRDVGNELCLSILAFKKNRYTESFLFLYRMLERMSSACPLIYASKEKDFRSAHKFLSGLFSDKRTPGELMLLQNFLKIYANENDIFRDTTLDIAIKQVSEDFAREMLSQWQEVIFQDAEYIYIDDELGIISCPYPKVASLIVAVRNRSFHNLAGRRNLDLYKLGGSDSLFKLVLPSFLQWTAYVFVDFAKWQVEACQQ